MIVVEYKVYVIIFFLCVDIIQVCLAVVWFVLSFRHEQVPYPEIAKDDDSIVMRHCVVMFGYSTFPLQACFYA